MRRRRGWLLALAVNIPLILLYGWSLCDAIQVTIQVKGDSFVATVNGYSLRMTDNRYPTGKVGLYLEDHRTQPMWGLVSGLARESITVTDLETGHQLLHRELGSQRRPSRPNRAILSLAGDEGWQDYLIQAQLPQDEERAGILVRASDSGSGYLFWLRPKHEDMGWQLWRDGHRVEKLAVGGFHQSFSSALKANLQEILGSYLCGLGMLLTFWAICPALAGLLDRCVRPLHPPIEIGLRRLSKVLAVLIPMAGTAVATVVATDLLGCIPHVQDSVAFLFQAKAFALGRLSVPSPPLPEFFEHEFILNRDGMWFSRYPPGHPLVLALGVLAGAPWLVSPILGGISLFLIYQLGKEIYSPGIGLLSAALGLLSPFFIFLSGSFMNHPTSLLFVLLFLLCFLKTQKSLRWWWPLLGGIAIGWAFITRQLTTIGVAFPFVVYALWQLRWDFRGFAPRYALMALGAMGPCLFLLWYNWRLTGDPFLNPQQLWWSFDTIGFGPHKGMHGGHTPARGLLNTWRNITALQAHLFGWPIYLTLAFTFLPFITFRASRWDRILLSSFFSLAAGYVFYWGSGMMYRPRYYYEALPALLLLTARGMAILAEVGQREGQRWPYALSASILVACLVAALIAHNLVYYLPRQWGLFRGYNHINTKAIDVVRRAEVHNAVVFVEHEPKWQWWKYGCVFSSNSPLLDSGVVYARDLGDSRNRKLLSLFPGRHFYRLRGEQLIPLDYSK